MFRTGCIPLLLCGLLAASATAFTILKVVGAAYLLYLAIDTLRHGSALKLDRSGQAGSLGAIYVKSLLINLLNPKVIVFFVTFLPQFVSPADPHAPGKLLFLGLLLMLLNIPIATGLILAAERVAGLLKGSARVTRFVDWLFAGVLGAFAAKLVLSQSR